MVFGRVIGGIDVVRQIESLPVDANSRPLQDAKIIKCGELVKQVKGNKKAREYITFLLTTEILAKKEKRQKEEAEEEKSDVEEEKKHKKKHKKEKKRDKKDKKHR